MNSIAYLNGEYIPLQDAKVSVLDRGFLFGDGVYEVIPVYSGICLRGNEHLERLKRSLSGLDISINLSLKELSDIIHQVIEKNGSGNQHVYLQITRGTMQHRLHSWDDDLIPNILIMTTVLSSHPSQAIDSTGSKAITLDDIRWDYCHLKTVNLLPNVLLRQQAIGKQAVEAILIRDGNAIEGAGSNLFIVKDEVIFTPPKSNHLLGGITRELILELCQKHKILYRETPISEDDLHSADEIWMTASTKEIDPITTLNQHAVGKGVPGPMWLKLITYYQDYKAQLIEQTS